MKLQAHSNQNSARPTWKPAAFALACTLSALCILHAQPNQTQPQSTERPMASGAKNVTLVASLPSSATVSWKQEDAPRPLLPADRSGKIVTIASQMSLQQGVTTNVVAGVETIGSDSAEIVRLAPDGSKASSLVAGAATRPKGAQQLQLSSQGSTRLLVVNPASAKSVSVLRVTFSAF